MWGMDVELRQERSRSSAREELEASVRRIILWLPIPGVGLWMLGRRGLALTFMVAAVALLVGIVTDSIGIVCVPLAGVLSALQIRPLNRAIGATLMADAMPELLAEQPSARCARCASGSPTATGLCQACFGAVVPSERGSSILSAMAAGFNTRDVKASAAYTKYPAISHSEERTTKLTRQHDRTVALAVFTAYPGARLTPLGAFAERDDPTLIWLRFTVAGRGRSPSTTLHLERLSRVRLERGRVAEVWEHPPLAVADF